MLTLFCSPHGKKHEGLLKLEKACESQGLLHKEIRNEIRTYCVLAKLSFIVQRDLMKFLSFVTKIRSLSHEKDRLKCFRGVKIWKWGSTFLLKKINRMMEELFFFSGLHSRTIDPTLENVLPLEKLFLAIKCLCKQRYENIFRCKNYRSIRQHNEIQKYEDNKKQTCWKFIFTSERYLSGKFWILDPEKKSQRWAKYWLEEWKDP